MVEQRYKAVLEVLDGATVIDVARRNGVVRQTVHDWLRRYAAGGLAALVDGSSKPQSCPHQMAPEVEAAIRAAPGPSRLGPSHHRPPPAARRRCARPGPLVDLSLPGPPRPHRPSGPPQAPQRLQARGALLGHGAVADGHRGRRGPHRRSGGQDRHRHRRPLTVPAHGGLRQRHGRERDRPVQDRAAPQSSRPGPQRRTVARPRRPRDRHLRLGVVVQRGAHPRRAR